MIKQTVTMLIKTIYSGKETLSPNKCTTVDIVRHGNTNRSKTKALEQNEPRNIIVPSPNMKSVITT